MKERLVTSRMIVHALGRFPPCGDIAVITAGWDDEPSPLWRKRLARHVRDCQWCLAGTADMLPAERLLGGLPLLAVPACAAPGPGGGAARPGSGPPGWPAAAALAGRWPRRPPACAPPGTPGTPRILSNGAFTVQPKLIAVAVAVATCAAGGTFAVAHTSQPVARRRRSARPRPRRRSRSRPPRLPLTRRTWHGQYAAVQAAKCQAPTPPPATVSSARKGVSTWNFTGATQVLADSGASWYYNWGAAPNGIAAPASVGYIPMIWGAASVTAATLAQVGGEGHVLLGFNEPDLGSQSNMSVAQALELWPKLMATGMSLGSPAVASGAATPGGWLDQFMAVLEGARLPRRLHRRALVRRRLPHRPRRPAA